MREEETRRLATEAQLAEMTQLQAATETQLQLLRRRLEEELSAEEKDFGRLTLVLAERGRAVPVAPCSDWGNASDTWGWLNLLPQHQTPDHPGTARVIWQMAHLYPNMTNAGKLPGRDAEVRMLKQRAADYELKVRQLEDLAESRLLEVRQAHTVEITRLQTEYREMKPSPGLRKKASYLTNCQAVAGYLVAKKEQLKVDFHIVLRLG